MPSIDLRGIWLCLPLLFLGGCKVNYSFTGASVSLDVNTISIATFDATRTPLAPPSLSLSFTEALKDRFLRQTSLTLVKNNGDLMIDGEITGYVQRDEAATGTTASVTTLSRLTISVKVRFIDTKNEQNSYEQSFSNMEQFDASTQTLAEVEEQLIEAINEKLTQDIFNRTLGNW
ncbi:MAG: LptE family protein [Flavobacteriales bacterium]|nr:LptE family protein [Flavobacteriales bacterium]